jgi:hypothetical protein
MHYIYHVNFSKILVHYISQVSNLWVTLILIKGIITIEWSDHQHITSLRINNSLQQQTTSRWLFWVNQANVKHENYDDSDNNPRSMMIQILKDTRALDANPKRLNLTYLIKPGQLWSENLGTRKSIRPTTTKRGVDWY